MAINIIAPSVMRGILDGLKVGAALLDAAEVHLFKEDIELTPSTTLAELEAVECDFTGYSQFDPVVWGSAYTDVLGNSHLPGGQAQFLATGSVVTNNVYGFWIQNATTLLAAQKFPDAIPITAAGQAIVVDPTYDLAPGDEDSTNLS